MRQRYIFIALSICVSWGAAGETARIRSCKTVNPEYEALLDSYFDHVHGTSSSALILRVYGGREPEYEIVLDPDSAPNKMFRYSAAEPIAQTVYTLAGVHRTMQEYAAEAIRVPVAKIERDVSEDKFSDLIARAKAVDKSVCEKVPLTDRRGNTILVFDAVWFELISDGGQSRVRVTNADRVVVTQNAKLLALGRDLQKAFEKVTTSH